MREVGTDTAEGVGHLRYGGGGEAHLFSQNSPGITRNTDSNQPRLKIKILEESKIFVY